jgi:hypothetical protein
MLALPILALALFGLTSIVAGARRQAAQDRRQQRADNDNSIPAIPCAGIAAVTQRIGRGAPFFITSHSNGDIA